MRTFPLLCLTALASAAATRPPVSAPFRFEANAGQTDARVRFLGQGAGYRLFLTDDAVALSLRSKDKARALRLRFAGASAGVEVSGREPLAAQSHYLIGNDRSKWRTGVPSYQRVSYRGVYPGIDAVFYGSGRQLEYDFVIAPGADPRRIRLSIDGAERLALNPAGDLVLHTSDGDVIQRRPVVYQLSAVGVRQPVAGRYRLRGREVAFELGAYDPTRQLVIDPVLSYASYLGGSGEDIVAGVGLDSAGNVYVAGSTLSSGFPTTTGVLDTSYNGGRDVVVSKFSQAGALLTSTYLGGASDDDAYGMAVRSNGEVYLAGRTASAAFPLASANDSSLTGSSDAFVARLNSAGTALLFSTYLGGAAVEQGNSIAVDSAGAAYVTGTTSSSDFPTPGGFDSSQNGGDDAFVAKFTAAGVQVYGTFLGGGANDFGNSVAVDTSGAAIVTGGTYSPNFPLLNAADSTFAGGSEAFVTRLSANGGSLLFSTYLGGADLDFGRALVVTASNSIWVTGNTRSADFPSPAGGTPYDSTINGNYDAFVTRFSSGGSLVYSSYLGGSVDDAGSAIGVDSANAVYVAGLTNSTDFPVVNAAGSVFAGGNGDGFIAKFHPTGNSLAYSRFYGGSIYDRVTSLSVQPGGVLWFAGESNSNNLPTVSAYDASANGVFDIFFGKLTETLTDLRINSLTGAPPSPAYIGLPITFTFSVGVPPGAATGASNVTLQTVILGAATWGSVTTTQGTCSGTPAFCNLGNIPPGGAVTVTVTLTPNATGSLLLTGQALADEPDSLFANNTASIFYSVKMQSQNINFPAIPDQTANAVYPLNATASSGLPVTYTRTGNCTISGNQVTSGAAGSCTITATQAGNATFDSVSATRSFNISPAALGITLTGPASIVYGQQATFTANLSPAPGGGTVTFYDGLNILGSMPSSSTVTFKTVMLPQGTRSVRARFNGFGAFAGLYSAPVPVNVTRVQSVTFTAPVSYSSPGQTRQLVTEDFNGDGRLDVAGIGSGSHGMVVFLNSSTGLQAAVGYLPGMVPNSAVAGDVDEDGRQDIVVSQSNGLRIMKGDGAGGFTNPVYYPQTCVSRLFAADLNRDGHLDLLSHCSGSLYWFLGNGNGSFAAPSSRPVASSSVTTSVATADFNGDGNLDVAVANGATGNVEILLGDGAGQLGAPVAYPALSPSPAELAVVDLDGDGKQDILATGPNGDAISIVRGNGDGTFQPRVTLLGSGHCTALAVADFDGDGDHDAICRYFNYAHYFATNGSIFLSPRNFDNVFGQSFSARAGDLNGDGRPDVVWDSSNSGIRVMYGAVPATITASPASQTAPLNTAFAGPLRFTVRDSQNQPLQNVPVTLNVPGTGASASLNIASGLTDVNGQLTVVATANATTGTYALAATADGLTGSPATINLTNVNLIGPPATIALVSGSPQTTLVNTAFAQPLSVRVQDTNANNLSGISVTFVVTAGGCKFGSLAGTLAITASTGIATTPALSGGATPAVCTVQVSAGSALLNIGNLTVQAGTATLSFGTNYRDATYTVSVNGTPTNYTGPASVTVGQFDTVILSQPATQSPTPLIRYAPYGFSGLPGNATTLTTPISNLGIGSFYLAAYKLTLNGTVTAAPTSTDGFYPQSANSYQDVVVTGVCPLGAPVLGLTKTAAAYYAVNAATQTPAGSPIGIANGATVTMDRPWTIDVVCPPATTTTLTVSPSGNVYQGQLVTLTANVSPAAATGTVSFYDGSTLLGSNTLSGGTTSIQLNTLPVGLRSIRARYLGNGTTYGPSVSAQSTFTVLSRASDTFVYTSQSFIATGTGPQGVAVGDWNGDGRLDVATANSSSNNVTVAFGNGVGLFTPAPGSPYAAVNQPRSLTSADVNGDGRLDLLVANLTGQVSILLGAASGPLTAGTTVNTGLGATSITSADFNGDGFADFATANTNDENVTIALGNGAGVFTTSNFSTGSGSGPTFLRAADLDGDGVIDLAVAHNSAGVIGLYKGNGTGGFAAFSGSPLAAGNTPNGLVLTDFDGDGDLDLAVINAAANSNFRVWLNNGTAAYTALGAATTISPGFTPRAIAALEVNADSRPDLVIVGQSGSGFAHLRLWNGSGFSSTLAGNPFDLMTSPSSVATGDFNGDGRADFVASHQGSNSFVPMLGVAYGPPTTINVAAGNNQGATITTAFATPLAVTVADSNGTLLPGITVTFAPPSTGPSASLSALTATTDASGFAFVNATANGQAGTYPVTASVGTLSTTFNLTNHPPGSVTLILDAIPDSAQAFTFNASWTSNVTLDDDGPGGTATPNTNVYAAVPLGTRSIQLGSIPTGWVVSDIVCTGDNGNSSVNITNRVANLTLDPAENITCTFTVRPMALIMANDAVPSDFFGQAVANDGTTIAVGRPYNSTGNVGSVYIFQKVAGVWTQKQKITASDGTAGNYFGRSVGVEGDTLAVGANNAPTSSGSMAHPGSRPKTLSGCELPGRLPRAPRRSSRHRRIQQCQHLSAIRRRLDPGPVLVASGGPEVPQRRLRQWHHHRLRHLHRQQ